MLCWRYDLRNRNINPTFILIIVILAASSIRSGSFASDPMAWVADKVMLIPAIVIGLSFHEFAHAFVADKCGDPTPKLQGRVTLNPLAHIDWMGLAALFFCGFGWGIPVQIDPRNFRHRRRDELFVALAGVVMNLLVAIVFAVICKIVVLTCNVTWLTSDGMGGYIWTMLLYVIQINLVLMIFNLIPVPPLDGFNILAQIVNIGNTKAYWTLYRYGSWILIALIIFGITGMIISPCVSVMMNLLFNLIIL